MKKRIIIAGCFFILAALFTIWVLPPVAEPLELPESDQLRSVTVSYEDSSVIIEDTAQRGELMDQLRSSRPTRLQSVNDTPAAEEWSGWIWRTGTAAYTSFSCIRMKMTVMRMPNCRIRGYIGSMLR